MKINTVTGEMTRRERRKRRALKKTRIRILAYGLAERFFHIMSLGDGASSIRQF